MVTYYSYRKAQVISDLRVPRELMRGLEKELARQAGAPVDNHVVYVVEGHCGLVVFGFADDWVAIGNEHDLVVGGF